MKNLSITLAALFIVLSSCAKAPENGYKKFYREYRNADHTITFKIPGAFAGMFIDDEDEEVKDFVKNMDDISFFIADKTTKQMIIDLNKNLPESLYKEIMIVRDGDTEVIFLARDNGESIEEILMTVYEPDNLVVMCMYGEFTRENAKKIAKAINTESAINIRH